MTKVVSKSRELPKAITGYLFSTEIAKEPCRSLRSTNDIPANCPRILSGMICVH